MMLRLSVNDIKVYYDTKLKKVIATVRLGDVKYALVEKMKVMEKHKSVIVTKDRGRMI